MKLRIQTDIQQRAPGIFSRKALSLFLHRHTTSTAYIRALLAAAQRFDLDGQPAGEISEEHRAAAVTEMERRKAIVQERRAAERQHHRPQERQQQRSQPQPQQQLQQLQQRPPQPHLALPEAATTAAAGVPSTEAEAGPAQPHQPHQPQQPNLRPQRPAGSRPPRQAGPRRAQGPAGDHTTHGPDSARGNRPGERQNARAPQPDRGDRAERSNRSAAGRSAPGPVRDVPAAPAAATAAATAAPTSGTGDPAADAARRERSALLRTFEGSTLTKSNFLVLKRMTEADFDTQLALARQERQQQPAPHPQQHPQPHSQQPAQRAARPNRR